jgi:hypothetical protein
MKIRWTKFIFALAVGAYFVSLALSPETYRWIDAFDLIFHEAGHTLFGFLPYTVMLMGGSITQVAIPLIVAVSCWFKGYRYTSGLMLFWTGQSLMNVSVYAADALKMQLPLISDSAEHDWNYILWRLGGLHHVAAVAGTIRALGWIFILGALALCVLLSVEREAKAEPPEGEMDGTKP